MSESDVGVLARRSHEAMRESLRVFGIGGVPMVNRQGVPVAVALVDLDDEAALRSRKWFRTHWGYAAFGTDGTRMHRVLFGLEPKDGLQIDHRNGDRLDNRRMNLRVIPQGLNAQNLSAHRSGTSTFRGVSWHRASKRWRAAISINGHSMYLGLFTDERAAAGVAQAWREKAYPAAVPDRAQGLIMGALRSAAVAWEESPGWHRATMLATFRGLLDAGVIVAGPAVVDGIREEET